MMILLPSLIVVASDAIVGVLLASQFTSSHYVPPAQYCVMFFLLLFSVLVWVAQFAKIKEKENPKIRYRIIGAYWAFPFVAFAFALICAGLYLFAWNPLPEYASSTPVLTLQSSLPQEWLVPLIVGMVLLFGAAALWIYAVVTNKDTDKENVQQQEAIDDRKELLAQVDKLKQHSNSSGKRIAQEINLIKEKVEALQLDAFKTAKADLQDIEISLAAMNDKNELRLADLKKIYEKLARF